MNSLLFRVAAALGFVALVVAGMFAAFLWSADTARDANTVRDHAADLDRLTDHALRHVLDAETSARGFVITLDPRFLQPWRRAQEVIDGELHDLAVAARPLNQEVAAQRLAASSAAYVHGFSRDVVRLARREPAAARALVRTGEGKRRVDAIRSQAAGLIDAADVRARAAASAAERTLGRAMTLGAVGLGSAILLFAALGGYLGRSVLQPLRVMSQAARRLGAGDRGARAPAGGTGEVAEMGRAFNEMAASVEEGVRLESAQKQRLEESRADAQRVAQELAAQQELAVDLVATVGFDGYFKRVNPAWERTLGYPEDELKSRPFIEYVHAEDRARTEAEAEKLSGPTAADTINFENRYRTADGAYRWLEWNVRPIAEQELLYAVARDVTERKDADEAIRAARDAAQQANLAKSEFLSRMSHELRTPLNAILGFGQLLEMDGLEGEQSESVDQILRGGRHLLGLIDEVLDISRIEAGTLRMSVEPVDVISALGDALALIKPTADAEGISLSIDHGDGAGCYVQADRQRLRQVILNLLSNAVKYNRPGGSVRVSVEADDGHVRVDVTDTGHGIAEQQFDRLFVAFDRLDAEAGPVQGTGLGLALSKNLAEEMGGRLSVQSTPGHGSVFSLDLLRAPDPIDEESLAGAHRAGLEAPAIGARTILYIEDNPSNAKLVSQALSSQPDVRLILAIQGSRGLDLARAHIPDLILLDLHLPDTDGSLVLERLQADPETAAIPVVILSADATQRQHRELMRRGASAYLTKPLDIREFLEVISEQLPAEVA